MTWLGVELKDPNYSAANKAMNAVNYNAGPRVVKTDADDNGNCQFHSLTSFLLHPNFPQNSEFVQDQLSSFFTIKEDMRSTFHQLIAEQQEVSKKRRPIGFTTGDKTE